MSKVNDLTAECRAGYDAGQGAKVPYYYSSACWFAFRAGQQVSAMSGIKKCRMSRGYSVRVETTGGNIVMVSFAKYDLTTVTVERL